MTIILNLLGLVGTFMYGEGFNAMRNYAFVVKRHCEDNEDRESATYHVATMIVEYNRDDMKFDARLGYTCCAVFWLAVCCKLLLLKNFMIMGPMFHVIAELILSVGEAIGIARTLTAYFIVPVGVDMCEVALVKYVFKHAEDKTGVSFVDVDEEDIPVEAGFVELDEEEGEVRPSVAVGEGKDSV